MQTKKQSFIEAFWNAAIGYVISVVIGYIVYNSNGLNVSVLKVSWLTLMFTVISVTRTFLVRRYFNKKESSSP